MKKMLLLATAATLLSMNANANMMQDMKPYIGLDYVYTDADISKVDHVSMYKHKFDSANINIGMRTCYMGIEAYYQKRKRYWIPIRPKRISILLVRI